MEMVYQYLWKHRLLGDTLRTVDGREIKVIRPGMHNTDSGPDFSGACLKIEGEQWWGNVEVHVKASDWHRHGHDNDPAYQNVILHIVAINDCRIDTPDGHAIPQVIATFPESFIRLYGRLSEKISDFRCEGLVSQLPELTIADWMCSLTVERMQQKAARILDMHKSLEGDWERTCFVALARALGFGLNSDPLEMTARSIELKTLLKHSDDARQLEALLLGQAGLLDPSVHIFDEYYQGLCREYMFLARKYGLRPMPATIWKYSKTRPQNFPTRRIAMLAQAVAGGFRFLSRLTARDCGPEAALQLMQWQLSDYWTTHFHFDVPGTALPATLSRPHKELLLINFVAPTLYAYGSAHADLDMADRAMAYWDELNAENNKYIRRWSANGIKCRCAADSQALIQLSREYCEKSRCLGCRFGHKLLRMQCLQPNH